MRGGVSDVYVNTFHSLHDENCRAKLGLKTYDDEAEKLWDDLFGLMAAKCGTGGVDFTILFRALGDLDRHELLAYLSFYISVCVNLSIHRVNPLFMSKALIKIRIICTQPTHT